MPRGLVPLQLALLLAIPAGLEGQSGSNLSTGFDQESRVLIADGEADGDYLVTGPAGSGIGPGAPRVVASDGFPIPPWFEGSGGSRWIGLDGGDSLGPEGTYRYGVTVVLGPEVNPDRVELSGGWAAAGSGLEVLVNSVAIAGIVPPGHEGLTVFPAALGRGLFVSGENRIEFVVSSASPGPTGLRVEAWVDSAPLPDLLDISTGYNQSSAHPLSDGEVDEDYTVASPGAVLAQAEATAEDGFPVPPWISGTPTSRWAGVTGDDSRSASGEHTFQVFVDLEGPEDAARAVLRGVWAADDEGTDVLVNGISTGARTASGHSGLTRFPPGLGRGLFHEGTNSIEFVVLNVEAGSPVGLRVDAVVSVVPAPGGPPFVRGDVDGDERLDLTDPIAGLTYLFLGGGRPPCLDALDADDNGALDLSDPVVLLGYLFLGSRPPDPPRSCGGDLTEDALSCEAFPACL